MKCIPFVALLVLAYSYWPFSETAIHIFETATIEKVFLKRNLLLFFLFFLVNAQKTDRHRIQYLS